MCNKAPMKKLNLVFGIALFTVSAQVAHADILICKDSYSKIGLDSASSDFYEASVNTKDEDVVNQINAGNRVGVSYNSDNASFTASGEEGCTEVNYETKITSKGEVILVKTSSYDHQPEVTQYSCKWLGKL